ncbi:hypothetical protein PIB30_037049 [Stylosanthes scabra]|uniref:Uncharacterized protein n=1 Tax=Stylosanthes scabra TaxID=79078 RepID=A0ABU6UFK3_9FABA|nr:hypothetical protein [Stylosanthes scabra]
MVLGYERVDRISPTYIPERWCKNDIVNRRHMSIKSSYDAPVLQPRTKRYNDKLDAEMKEFKAKLKENPTMIYEDGSLSEVNDLQSPTHVRSRGWSKKRLGSNSDKK